MWLQAKQRVFKILDYDPSDDFLERAVDVFMTPLVLLNVLAVILGTVEPIYSQHESLFEGFEVFSVLELHHRQKIRGFSLG